jgi:hypothetical protein
LRRFQFPHVAETLCLCRSSYPVRFGVLRYSCLALASFAVFSLSHLTFGESRAGASLIFGHFVKACLIFYCFAGAPRRLSDKPGSSSCGCDCREFSWITRSAVIDCLIFRCSPTGPSRYLVSTRKQAPYIQCVFLDVRGIAFPTRPSRIRFYHCLGEVVETVF